MADSTKAFSTCRHLTYVGLPMAHIFNCTMTFNKYLSIYKVVKLSTLVEGDPKAPFSIATTSRDSATSFHFTLDPYFIVLSA